MTDSQILILAGGQGTRLPQYDKKELIPLNNKAIILHLLENIKKSGVCRQPAIVVGYKAKELINFLGPDYLYCYQKEQLGTGHAVMSARGMLAGRGQNVIVLYGDHPFVSAETIKALNRVFREKKPTLALITIKLPDYNDWRQTFYDFGRVVRDQAGNIQEIVELKDTTDQQKSITEVNPSYYCFEADWLWKNLDKLSTNNQQGEYYLTDLIKIAFDQGCQIETISCANPLEGLGINTPEQLEIARKATSH